MYKVIDVHAYLQACHARIYAQTAEADQACISETPFDMNSKHLKKRLQQRFLKCMRGTTSRDYMLNDRVSG